MIRGGPCPTCTNPITVDVCVNVHLTWLQALKFRLAGPEVRVSLLDEIRCRLAEASLRRHHPEND